MIIRIMQSIIKGVFRAKPSLRENEGINSKIYIYISCFSISLDTFKKICKLFSVRFYFNNILPLFSCAATHVSQKNHNIRIQGKERAKMYGDDLREIFFSCLEDCLITEICGGRVWVPICHKDQERFVLRVSHGITLSLPVKKVKKSLFCYPCLFFFHSIQVV